MSVNSAQQGINTQDIIAAVKAYATTHGGDIPEVPLSVDEIIAGIRQQAAINQNNRQTVDAAPVVTAAQPAQPVGDSNSAKMPGHFLRGKKASFEHQQINGIPTLKTGQKSYHINDLMRFHDHSFVTNAYYVILQRAPDEAGAQGFINGLRSGTMSRIRVLLALSDSAEGKRHQVKIEGLWLPRLSERLYRLPILGYVARLAAAVIHLPRLVRSFSQLEAHVFIRQQNSEAHINQLSKSLARSFATVDGNLLKTTHASDTMMSSVMAEQAEEIARLEALLANKSDETEVAKKADAQWVQQQLTNKADSEWAQQQLASKAGMQWSQDRLADKAGKQWTADRLDEKVDAQQFDQQLSQQRQALNEALADQAGIGLMDDALYQRFEDAFRGSSEDILGRLGAYRGLLESLFADENHQSGHPHSHPQAIDIGCGRGEWLELLKQLNISALGVDINQSMAGHCVARGHEIVIADGIDYLATLEENSVSLISGFHIIEHISFARLLKLYQQAYRVLKPGGMVIFETPNPMHLLVGTADFYLDPSHRQPLHPLATQFFVNDAGFEPADIYYLGEKGLVSTDQHPLRSLEDFFTIGRDYCIAAYKPTQESS